MGSKQAQALLAALISAPLAAQDNLLINPGFEQGTVGWSSQWPGGVYGGCGPFGGACYTFSFLATTTAQTVSTPETYNEFTVSFQYRLPCNNSIGGWCQNPNGPQDWLTANLNLFLGGEPVQSVPLLSLQTYQPQYETFSLTGTSTGFNAATLSFTAQDVGFWGGPYGPQIDNASLSFSSAEPPPPPPLPEPEPEPVVPVPDAVNPAPDVTPDPVQEEVLQNEPEPEQEAVVEATVEEEMIVEEAVSEEDIVSDDVAAQEEVDGDQAEDANDEPLSPDQLQALSAIETSEPPTAEEVTQAIEAIAEEAQAAEAARISGANGETSGNSEQASSAEKSQPEAAETEIQPQSSDAISQPEMAPQTEVVVEQSVQQEVAQLERADEQTFIGPETQERAVAPSVEMPETVQAQPVENIAISTQQEQATIVVEETSVEAQQTLQQSEQVKEPERLIDSIMANFEGYQDINTAFFNKEAIEDADTFQRERVIPVNVADVATVVTNNAELAQTIGEQTTTETPAGTYDIVIIDGPTFMPTPTTGMGDMTSPAGQAQQLELLGMQAEMSAGPVIDVGDVNNGDNEAMSQLAAIPAGYSAYTQARIPDSPFYQPRDIYKGRRIPDANLALFRMMRGQDERWQEMVDAQYE